MELGDAKDSHELCTSVITNKKLFGILAECGFEPYFSRQRFRTACRMCKTFYRYRKHGSAGSFLGISTDRDRPSVVRYTELVIF